MVIRESFMVLFLPCLLFFLGGGGGGGDGVKVYGVLCRFDVKMRGVVACCLPPPVLFIPLERIQGTYMWVTG